MSEAELKAEIGREFRRAERKLRTRGFQAGWNKNPDGSVGPKLNLVSCSPDCFCGPGCLNCPAHRRALEEKLCMEFFRGELLRPFSWTTPKSVFLCSEGDLLHKDVPDLLIAEALATAESFPWHVFILLTKRAERLAKLLSSGDFRKLVIEAGRRLFGDRYLCRGRRWGDNMVVGVSVEDQAHMNRAYALAQLPVMICRALCISPMLEPVAVPTEIWPYVDWLLCSGEVGGDWCENPRPCKFPWQKELLRDCHDHGVRTYLLRRHHQKWVAELDELGIDFQQFPVVKSMIM